jgi:hypothetical protein
VSSPPKNNPTAEPSPLIPAHTPSALCRSESWKVVVRMDSAAGDIIAAPKPWASRAPTSSPWLSANPQASEETANSAVPAISSRRRPSRLRDRPVRALAGVHTGWNCTRNEVGEWSWRERT